MTDEQKKAWFDRAWERIGEMPKYERDKLSLSQIHHLFKIMFEARPDDAPIDQAIARAGGG